jgi:hypothetical protein
MAPSRLAIIGNHWQSLAIIGNHWQSLAINGNRWQSMAINSTQWNSISIQWQSAHLLEDGEHVSPELLRKGGEREHERSLREIVNETQLVPAQLRERLEPAASELVRGEEDNQWQSMAINDNQWQSMAINGNQWQSMAINGIRFYQRTCVRARPWRRRPWRR